MKKRGPATAKKKKRGVLAKNTQPTKRNTFIYAKVDCKRGKREVFFARREDHSRSFDKWLLSGKSRDNEVSSKKRRKEGGGQKETYRDQQKKGASRMEKKKRSTQRGGKGGEEGKRSRGIFSCPGLKNMDEGEQRKKKHSDQEKRTPPSRKK